MNTQINIEHNETEEITEINQTENDNSKVEPQLSRRSNRKTLEHKSSQEQWKYIICNTDRFLKGRKVALQNLSLKRKHDGSYVAEETLKEYANVHIALNNQQYIEGAKRILLMLNTTSLFAADVSYHRTCYDSFRTSWWKKKLESLNSSTNNPDVEVTNDTPINELFHLIDYYIIHRQEIYTLAQLRHFYEQLNEKEEHPVLRSIDIKEKLIEKFK